MHIFIQSKLSFIILILNTHHYLSNYRDYGCHGSFSLFFILIYCINKQFISLCLRFVQSFNLIFPRNSFVLRLRMPFIYKCIISGISYIWWKQQLKVTRIITWQIQDLPIAKTNLIITFCLNMVPIHTTFTFSTYVLNNIFLWISNIKINI